MVWFVLDQTQKGNSTHILLIKQRGKDHNTLDIKSQINTHSIQDRPTE